MWSVCIHVQCAFFLFSCVSVDDSELDSDLASDDDDTDDDIDYFADVPSEDSEGGSPEGTKRAHYEDFFDAPDDYEEETSHPNIKQNRREKKLERAIEEEREGGEREEGERDSGPYSDAEEESSGDEGELSELPEDEASDGEGEGEEEGSASESGAEEEEREGEEERRGEEVVEGEKQHTLSSHEKKQLKVSWKLLLVAGISRLLVKFNS